MKKRFVFIALLLVVSLFTLSACDILANIPGFDGILGGDTPGGDLPGPGGDNKPDHQHSFVDGKCECGEEDPNYVPPHEHSFVDGKCECGEEDPNYVPPHEHSFVDGKCECGEEDPDYVPEPEVLDPMNIYLVGVNKSILLYQDNTLLTADLINLYLRDLILVQ